MSSEGETGELSPGSSSRVSSRRSRDAARPTSDAFSSSNRSSPTNELSSTDDDDYDDERAMLASRLGSLEQDLSTTRAALKAALAAVRSHRVKIEELEAANRVAKAGAEAAGGHAGPGSVADSADSAAAGGLGGPPAAPGSPNRHLAVARGENRKLREALETLEGKFSVDYAAIKERENIALSEKNSDLFAKWQEERSARMAVDKIVDGFQDKNDRLRGKIKRLLSTVTNERDARRRSEDEVDELQHKVQALSEHIEKMVVALRLQAKKKTTTSSSNREMDMALKLTTKKCELYKTRSLVAERAITQLKTQSEMLTGQLKLADERYVSVSVSVSVLRRDGEMRICRMSFVN